MTIHLISYTNSNLSLIDEITPCFSPVKIYVPWGGAVPEYAGNSEITTLNPPEEFKPEADFNMLLDECFNWAYEQSEKSRKEIIKTGHIDPTSNESLRHIKSIISNRISDSSQKDMVVRWHMLLHLAGRLEQNRSEANRMLENLNKKPSPLLHNADLTENTQYPLENLRGIDSEFFINDTNIKMLLRAWHGLFNSLIDNDDLLLTVDRRIFDHLSDEWDILNNNSGLKNPGIITFKCPMLKRVDIKSTEITIGDDIRNIAKSESTPEDKIIALKKVTSEFESAFQSESVDNHILFSLQLFQPAENPEEVIKDPVLKFLSERTLIFAEKNG